LKDCHFSSDAEVTAASETWLEGQLSEFFLFEWLAVAFSLTGQAKELSAPRYSTPLNLNHRKRPQINEILILICKFIKSLLSGLSFSYLKPKSVKFINAQMRNTCFSNLIILVSCRSINYESNMYVQYSLN